MKKLVIIGMGEFALLAYEYFSVDSSYQVVGFGVHKIFKGDQNSFNGLPLVSIEEMQDLFDTNRVEVFVAIPASKMNQSRTMVYLELKEMGFKFATYISSQAFVWRNVEIGENCFIFEGNVLQPFSEVRSNCVLWSGNHIGHRSTLHSNTFITSHSVISGYCSVGQNSFIGVNSTVIDNIKIAPFTLVGAGSLINRDTLENTIYVGNPAKPVAGKFATDSKI
jgi:sugar O-acyltransferase (sialic acid O-acetyltransferase NeuD family)